MRRETSARISEGSETSRGLGGAEVRQDEGYGLRMLAVDEFGELLGVGFLQDVEVGVVAADGFR